MAILGTAKALREKLRRRLGYGCDTALVADDLLTDALEDALREVNKHFPKFAVGSFTTTAGVQVYSPLPSGGRSLERVFWGTRCNTLSGSVFPPGFESEMSALFGNVSEEGIRYTIDPAAMVIFQREREWLQRWLGKGGIVSDPNQAYLRPKPSVTGTTVYFVYGSDRFATIEDVDDSIEEVPTAFWARARWYGFDVLSSGAGAMTEAKAPDGTTWKGDRSKGARESRDRADEEFLQSLPMDLVHWPNIAR